MMKDVQTATNAEEEKDTLGGFQIYESDLYKFNVDTAYIDQADSGAYFLALSLVNEEGGIYKENIYFTSGKAKGTKTFYEKDGKQHNLPGYNIASAIAQFTVGKDILEVPTSEKTLNIYDSKAKKETPQKKDVVMDMLQKPIALGVLRQTVNKTVNKDGKYVPIPEFFDTNVIDRVFHPETGCTLVEHKAGESVGEFQEKWQNKHGGMTQDRRTIKSGGDATKKPKKKLF